MVGPAVKRDGVAHLRATMGLSERRACSIVSADRKMVRYRSCRPPDTELRTQLRDLANARRRFGYRRLFILLRQDGERSGVNRVYRLYREEGLTVRKRRARRRAVGSRAPILVEPKPNARWSVDFVHDQLACGRRFRILNIVDDVTRECLAAIPGTSISGRRVARGTDGVDQTARQARHDRLGQWDRVHLERHVRLGAGQQGRLAFHRARKADAERLLRGISTGACATSSSTRSLFLDLDHARTKITNWVDDYQPAAALHSRRWATSRRRLMPPISPQPAIVCATPTSSADRMLLHPRPTA